MRLAKDGVPLNVYYKRDGRCDEERRYLGPRRVESLKSSFRLRSSSERDWWFRFLSEGMGGVRVGGWR